MAKNAYSFQDVVANITGPGGSFSLGSGASVADEGITFEKVQDDNTMVTGADGSFTHNRIAGSQHTATVRLLKTSETNNKLRNMYNFQQTTGIGWGENIISLSHTTLGDSWTLAAVAFKKAPPITYSKEAEIVEWTFDVGTVAGFLGNGISLIS